MKGVILALVLALLTAAWAWGFALAAPPRRIRSVAVSTARLTPDGVPTVCWIVEAAEGTHRLRCSCDILTAQVLGTAQVP